MGRKGLYSHSARSGTKNWGTYVRLIIPTEPLCLYKLPLDVQNILESIKIPAKFSKEPKVFGDWVPERLLPDGSTAPAIHFPR